MTSPAAVTLPSDARQLDLQTAWALHARGSVLFEEYAATLTSAEAVRRVAEEIAETLLPGDGTGDGAQHSACRTLPLVLLAPFQTFAGDFAGDRPPTH